MKKELEKVSIVRCNSYKQEEVDKAVRKALKLADIELPKRKKVLIKPNIVGIYKKNQIAVSTNPSIVEAICKLLKENNCRTSVGESSFMNTEEIFAKSGIGKVAKKYGKQIIFEQDKLVRIHDNKAKILNSFQISKTLKDADLIINLPKLKTHQLAKYTGAIKNLYGCIPGGMKQKLHKKAQTQKKFARLLIDIYQNIKPEINIMDAVIGMEGKGPSSGEPRKTNYILASKNSVSLDVASAKLMGYNPKKIPAIKEAVKRKLGSYKFQLVGLNKLPDFNFEKPHVEGKLTKGFLNLFRQRPIVVDEKKCIKCGTCMRKCPMHAITLKPYPIVNREKCIRCFCCMEICRQGALSLKEH